MPARAVHRAMVRYESVKPDDAAVRRRLHELAKGGEHYVAGTVQSALTADHRSLRAIA